MSDLACLTRPLGALELDALAELHAACFAEAWDVAALATLLAMPGAYCLVAESGGQPAWPGFVMARAAADEAEIVSLGVRPGMRRRGLGRRLLDAVAGEAAKRGAARLFLEVAADNEAARGLYRGAGFAEVGRRPDYYHRPGGSVPALVMARDITIGANVGAIIEEEA